MGRRQASTVVGSVWLMSRPAGETRRNKTFFFSSYDTLNLVIVLIGFRLVVRTEITVGLQVSLRSP